MGGGLTRGQRTSSKASDLDDITADLLRYVLLSFSNEKSLFSPFQKWLTGKYWREIYFLDYHVSQRVFNILREEVHSVVEEEMEEEVMEEIE